LTENYVLRAAPSFALLVAPHPTGFGGGSGTAWLQRREQTRIAEQREEAMTSRRTAVLERSGLIVESVEALLADVQNSLATSLRDSPRGREQRYLEELRESNFLVEDVFGATAAGEVRGGRTKSRHGNG